MGPAPQVEFRIHSSGTLMSVLIENRAGEFGENINFLQLMNQDLERRGSINEIG